MSTTQKYIALKGATTCQEVKNYGFANREAYIKFMATQPILPITRQMEEGVEFTGRETWQFKGVNLKWYPVAHKFIEDGKPNGFVTNDFEVRFAISPISVQEAKTNGEGEELKDVYNLAKNFALEKCGRVGSYGYNVHYNSFIAGYFAKESELEKAIQLKEGK